MTDTIFEVLAAQQRRTILLEVLAGNPASDHVETADSGAASVTEVSAERAALYHNHLPKLEQEGFIRWDRDEHVIEKGPRFSEIKPMLELLDDHAEDLPGDWP
jgi:hypothetical protein